MKKFIITIVATCMLALLAACGTSYQQSGFLRGGYTETQLGENVFQVRFKGNARTSKERASDFTLLRSAEVALENGFQFFIITESVDESRTGKTPSDTTTHTTFTGGLGTSYGSTSIVSATSQSHTTGGQVYVKPGLSNTIICYKTKPDIGGVVYDASYVESSLKKKYEL